MKKKKLKRKVKRQTGATLEISLVSKNYMTIPKKFLIEIVEIKEGGK